MSNIEVKTRVATTPEQLWNHLQNIASHVQWMADAESITFRSDQTEGVGTEFECKTKVGPFRLTDVMTITEWTENERMGVVHSGLVTGTGAFQLAATDDETTEFTWSETLEFPWWMGGPIGAFFAKPILTAIWRGNLKRLKKQVETST